MTRKLRSLAVWLGLAAASCNEQIGPGPDDPTFMRVSVSITGGDLDLDGFTVMVDGRPKGTISTTSSSTTEIHDLSRGSHEVTLSGIAANCDLQGPPVRQVELPSLLYYAASFTVVCYATGIEVGNVTNGIDFGTAYAVQVGSSPDIAVTANSTMNLGRMAPGVHTVTFKLDPSLTNCSVDGGVTTRQVNVVFRELTPVSFGVTCFARFGGVQVQLQLSGLDGDATAYLASLDNGTPRRLSPIGRVIFDTVTVGEHSVQISGGRANCTLTGPPTTGATVQAGTLVRQFTIVNFQAACVELERRIAFTRYPFENPYWGYDPFVAIATETGSNLVLLSPGASPSWSPDGERIVFTRFGTGCYFGCTVDGIFTMKRDGTGLVRLTSGNEDHNPAWSPDGTKIVFQRGNRLMLMNADGSSPAFIPNIPTLTAYDPAWSPDGTRLTFACPADAGGMSRICLINPDGTGFVRLEVAGWAPSWHPDGTRLIFAASSPLPNSMAQVRTVKPDGTDQVLITDGESPVWSRDGSRIFFIRNGSMVSCAPDGTDVREIVSVSQGWNYAPSSR